jgi:hypothetical protein
LSLTTDGTWSTRRFSTTSGAALATVRSRASGSRDEVRMIPSTRVRTRSNNSCSVDSDSCVSASTRVYPACPAVRSAPRIIPKFTGLVMSATTMASMRLARAGALRW